MQHNEAAEGLGVLVTLEPLHVEEQTAIDTRRGSGHARLVLDGAVVAFASVGEVARFGARK